MGTKFIGALFALAMTFAFVTWGCGSGPASFFDDGGAGDDGGGGGGPDGDILFPESSTTVDACTGLACQVPTCMNGGTTSISGTVYAPNGTLPLYNVIVYVPNADLQPFTDGVTCDQCGVLTSGSPIAVTLTDSKGNFKLTGVPAGTDIPLVMQVGKWRRKITLPSVAPCTDNVAGSKMSGVEQQTRLPKKRSEGDMPNIGVTVGGCDAIACVIPKLGIDPSEYSAGPTSASMKPKTAVSFYNDGSFINLGPSTWPPANTLWKDLARLKMFDLMIYTCECFEPSETDATSYQTVRNYLEAGGRIFTTDFMYTWYKYSSDTNLNSSPWQWPGGAPYGGTPFDINTTFPKGKSLSDWLYYVSGIDPYKNEVVQYPPTAGHFPVQSPFGNIHAINPKYGVEWASNSTTSGSPEPRFVTMNMPSAKPASMQCGKAVHLDAHISSGDTVDGSFPMNCNQNTRETELATIFFLFDLSSCIQDDTQPPVPPTPQ